MNSLSWERASTNQTSCASKSDLLAFGYSCKLFDNDNSANFLEKGQNLVPWSGDNKLLIDRFDVRGYLNASELQRYEAKMDVNYNDLLTTKEEIEFERKLDKERYRDLYETEQELNHEDELRRLKDSIEEDDKKYNQIQFNYNNLEQSYRKEDANDNQDNDELFVLPKSLKSIPNNIKQPNTMKEHNLIEKTAKFISKQGTQMEILLKTKQSSNSQFDFLNYDSALNPYYKYLVQVIKEKNYTDESDEEEIYLHPALQASNRSNENTSSSINNSVINSYNSSYLPNTSNVSSSTTTKPTNSLYSKLAENLKEKIVVNDKSYYKPKIIESKGVKYDSQSNLDISKTHTSVNSHNSKHNKIITTKNDSQSIKNVKSVFDLMPEISADQKLIIEKLAAYVCKNGDEFEKTVKSRNESRFEFLNPGHKYHFYYVKTKLNLLEEKRKQDKTIKHNSVESSINKKTIDQPSASIFSENSNSTNDSDCKSILPFMISTNKSKTLKDDLEAKKLKEKQEERKRKAALFLKKLELQKNDDEETVKLSPKEKIRNEIGPQLPLDKQREELRNTPSPLKEFFNDLDIKIERKTNRLIDEIKSNSSRDKFSNSPEKDQITFKKSKFENYRARSNSSSSISDKSSVDFHVRSNHKHKRSVSRSPSYRPRSRSRSYHRTRHSRSPKRRKSHRSRNRSKERKRSKERSKRI